MATSQLPQHVELTERDWQILRGLFESRIMTAAHVAALYFEGRAEAAKKRLWKLKHDRYIAERPRKAYDPAVLFLTRKAFRALIDHGRLDGYPPLPWSQMEKRARVSELTVRHELAVMDVKAALVSAVAKLPNFTTAEFSTWPLLSQFTARPSPNSRPILIKPDGFIRIHERDASGVVSEHAFFLEVDRSTETLQTLAVRATCYRDHYRSGGFAEQMGHGRSEFTRFPFRVLVVFKTAQRRDNFAQKLLSMRPPIISQVWLSTQRELTEHPVQDIWIRPMDYRECPAAVTAWQSPVSNQRESARDEHGRKLPLFTLARCDTSATSN